MWVRLNISIQEKQFDHVEIEKISILFTTMLSSVEKSRNATRKKKLVKSAQDGSMEQYLGKGNYSNYLTDINALNELKAKTEPNPGNRSGPVKANGIKLN